MEAESDRLFEDRIRRIAAGNRTALDHTMCGLLSRWATPILCCLLPSLHDREDCLQQAFLKLCRKLTTEEGCDGSPMCEYTAAQMKAFWVKTVLNCVRDLLRRKGRRRVQYQPPLESDPEHPSDPMPKSPEAVSTKEQRLLLLEYISHLPPDLRMIVALKLCGYTNGKAAELLGWGREMVRRRWCKALKIIKNCLAQAHRD